MTISFEMSANDWNRARQPAGAHNPVLEAQMAAESRENSQLPAALVVE
jgi:hypothetical protein